jgi:uncharacterized membrane-anchored protein
MLLTRVNTYDTITGMKEKMLNKVPEATILFWIIKVLTTGMGETTSDYFVRAFNPPIVIALAALLLIISLITQLSTSRYVAWVYWLAVIMVSVFGTMAADVLHIGLGIPYFISTIFFAIVLCIVFSLWYTKEKTLSIHSITTRRRELFYWATILTTFALGTAVGDMTATTLHLGYFTSGLLFMILMFIPVFAYWKFKMNEVLAFWFAYILTRPLGASFADWIGVSHARGGLALGNGTISLILFICIASLVVFALPFERYT